MTAVEFRVLGAVRALSENGDLDLGPPQQRCVLALLLLEARRLIHVDRLIDLVWAEEPPRGAKTTVRVYVSNLRKALAGSSVELVTSGPGYVLDLDPESVDVHRFRRLVAEAGSADTDERASDLLREAMALWQGNALDDVAPDHLRQTLCAALAEERLAASEQRVEIDLRLGRHAQVVPDLIELAQQNPLREHLCAQLMIALYRSGRRADALRKYQELRTRLAEELGVDPTPEVDDLHQAILRDDASLTASMPQGPTGTQPPLPAQLPADLQSFTGRNHELSSLIELMPTDTNERPPAVVISAIDGMAGVGKTALAVHTAHRLAPHFPDGQLFIDLHGFTQGVRAVEPAEALDRILRTLGVPGDQIPQRLDDRAGLYRSLLADRRMLILLDNAASESQVQPLLPAGPGCLALITSRRRLGGLDNVRPISLDILPPADAVTLFTRTAGPKRLSGEPVGLIADVVELCGRLPLAVRIAAARLRDRPTWTLSHLVDRLRDKRYGLFELDVGERSVTAAVGLSYDQLTVDQKQMFALMGLHPGPDIDAHAAAALCGSSVPIAARVLDELLDAHLLQQDRPGRHHFHDLIRAHAAHICAQRVPAEEQHEAVARLLDHYSRAASEAMNVLYPHEADRRPQIAAPQIPGPASEDPRAAAVWLDAELRNLLAVATYAASQDWTTHSLHLAATMHGHLYATGHYSEAIELNTRALEDARRTDDRAYELRALIGLAQVHRMQERHDQASECFERALELARGVGDRAGEIDSLIGLANVLTMRGRYGDATELFEPALALAHSESDFAGELEASIGLAFARWGQSQYEQAAQLYERSLHLAQRTGSGIGEVSAQLGLGLINRDQGRYSAASDCFERALHLSRSTLRDANHQESGLGLWRQGELNALSGLGDVYRARGRYDAATRYYRQVLHRARAIGNRNYQIEAMRGLGRTLLAKGDAEGALDHFQVALEFAHELGQYSDESRAHAGLARAYEGLGKSDQAREHWQHALDLLTKLDLAETKEVSAEEVRDRLLEARENGAES